MDHLDGIAARVREYIQLYPQLVHAKDNWEGSSLQKQSGEHKIDKELWKHIKEGRAQFSEYIYKNSKSTHVEIAKRKILGLKIAGVAGGILAAGAAIAQIASCGFASWGLTISSMPLWILPVRKIMDIERKIDTYRRYYDFSHKLHEIGKMLGDTQADQIEVFKMCTKKIPLTWDDMGNLREFYKEEIEEIQKRKLQAPAVLLS